jgi:ATP-binding cassette subfamily C (CFTR/MRP) protein 1
LSLLNILAGQFTQLFQAIPAMFAALACIGRVQTFLLAPDRRIDNRMSGSLLPAISPNRFSFFNGMIGDLLTDSPELDTFHDRLKKFATPLPPVHKSWDAVHLVGADFAWSRRRACEVDEKEDNEVLHNITANMPAEALTVIVGPVASGKSTLLKGILGEVYNTAGTVWVLSRTAAFCDQTAWLRNGSVQQNILGYSLWDADWYAAVVKACALEQDLARLPLGDQTVVGSEGIALSGGQIQRVVSICRLDTSTYVTNYAVNCPSCICKEGHDCLRRRVEWSGQHDHELCHACSVWQSWTPSPVQDDRFACDTRRYGFLLPEVA